MTIDAADKANILVVDDVPDKLLAIEAVLEELQPDGRLGRLRAPRRCAGCWPTTSPSSCSTSTCRAWTASRRPR